MPSFLSNRFLTSLSQGSRERLLVHAVAVSLPAKMLLYEAEQMPLYAYFVTSGVASIVTTLTDGGIVEVGMIGNEGVSGVQQIIGPAAVPSRCFVQLAGTAMRVPMDELRSAFRYSEEIRDQVLEFVQEQLLTLAQLAGCHRLHEAEERLARWLLMAQDRTQSDVLEFTQEFLAEMLGARRTTVTLVAGTLQRAGIIEYRRGRVVILDRKSLESVACDCYQVLKPLYDGLYLRHRLATPIAG